MSLSRWRWLSVYEREKILWGGWMVIIFGASLFLQPLLHSSRQQIAGWWVLRAEVQAALRMPAMLSVLRDDNQRLERQIKNVVQVLPSASGFSRFYGQLNSVCRARRIRLVHLKPGEMMPRPPLAELSLTLTVTGEFAGFLQFLNDLESLGYVQLTHLQISAADNNTPGMTIKMILSIFGRPEREGDKRIPEGG